MGIIKIVMLRIIELTRRTELGLYNAYFRRIEKIIKKILIIKILVTII